MSDCKNPRNSDVPIAVNEEDILIHKCETPEGGHKTVKAPVYTLVVKNPETD